MNASQITSLIAKVSHLLTPTAKYVFALYIRQAYVIGVENLLGGILLTIGGFLGCLLAYRTARKLSSMKDGFLEASGFEIVPVIFGGIGGIFVFGFGISTLGNALQYLINPQWAAIQMILGHAIGGN